MEAYKKVTYISQVGEDSSAWCVWYACARLIGSALGLAVEKSVRRKSQVQESNLQGQQEERGPGVSRQKLVTQMMDVMINRAEKLDFEEEFEVK